MQKGALIHIAAQIAAAVGQFMMEPSAELFGWTPALVGWLHALVSTVQAVAGILAVFYKYQPSQPE